MTTDKKPVKVIYFTAGTPANDKLRNDRDRARYYRRLCYRHACREFDKLPNIRRHEASWWVTCAEKDCEICNKEVTQ